MKAKILGLTLLVSISSIAESAPIISNELHECYIEVFGECIAPYQSNFDRVPPDHSEIYFAATVMGEDCGEAPYASLTDIDDKAKKKLEEIISKNYACDSRSDANTRVVRYHPTLKDAAFAASVGWSSCASKYRNGKLSGLNYCPQLYKTPFNL